MSIVALLLQSPAFACSIAGPEDFEISPELADGVVPGLPIVGGIDVQRGQGPRPGGMRTSCDDIGFIDIDVDQPDGAAVGYRVELVDGELPDDLGLPAELVSSPGVSFTWIDGATSNQEPFSFTVRITPVDEGGEEGDPVEVLVEDDASTAPTGCSTTGAAPVPLAGLGLVLFAASRRRR